MISIHLVVAVKVVLADSVAEFYKGRAFFRSDSLGFTRIEWIAHLPGKFSQCGLSLRMLRRVFCERLEPGNNFSLPFHVRVTFLRGSPLPFENWSLRAVIAPAQLRDVGAQFAEKTPAFGALGFRHSARRHGVARSEPKRQRVGERRMAFRIPVQCIFDKLFRQLGVASPTGFTKKFSSDGTFDPFIWPRLLDLSPTRPLKRSARTALRKSNRSDIRR